jgi:hypothetical protein
LIDAEICKGNGPSRWQLVQIAHYRPALSA